MLLLLDEMKYQASFSLTLETLVAPGVVPSAAEGLPAVVVDAAREVLEARNDSF